MDKKNDENNSNSVGFTEALNALNRLFEIVDLYFKEINKAQTKEIIKCKNVLLTWLAK